MKTTRILFPSFTIFALLLAGGLSSTRADLSASGDSDASVSTQIRGADAHQQSTNDDTLSDFKFDHVLATTSAVGTNTDKAKAEQHDVLTVVGSNSLTYTSSGAVDLSATAVTAVGFDGSSGFALSEVDFTVTQRASFTLSGAVAVEAAGSFDSSVAEVTLEGGPMMRRSTWIFSLEIAPPKSGI